MTEYLMCVIGLFIGVVIGYTIRLLFDAEIKKGEKRMEYYHDKRNTHR